jgi:hypothetical protein
MGRHVLINLKDYEKGNIYNGIGCPSSSFMPEKRGRAGAGA